MFDYKQGSFTYETSLNDKYDRICNKIQIYLISRVYH